MQTYTVLLFTGHRHQGIRRAMLAQVPDIARDYWKLGDKATMRDLLLSVRADEACHSHVNHTFAELDEDEKNPFAVGTHVVPTA